MTKLDFLSCKQIIRIVQKDRQRNGASKNNLPYYYVYYYLSSAQQFLFPAPFIRAGMRMRKLLCHLSLDGFYCLMCLFAINPCTVLLFWSFVSIFLNYGQWLK